MYFLPNKFIINKFIYNFFPEERFCISISQKNLFFLFQNFPLNYFHIAEKHFKIIKIIPYFIVSGYSGDLFSLFLKEIRDNFWKWFLNTIHINLDHNYSRCYKFNVF